MPGPPTPPPVPKEIDIDRCLREIISRMGSFSGDILATHETQTLAKAVALLAVVVAEMRKVRP